jgi:flagellar protein FlbD
MIKLTKFTGEELFLNPELIKTLEAGGDTIVHLTTGDRLLVRESPEEIKDKFLAFKKEVFAGFTYET